jgi:hypothetical protein
LIHFFQNESTVPITNTSNQIKMSSQTTTSQGKKTAFCNACFKAGKDESVYTNHFPKSSAGPNGVVVCPTILAASCNYCRKTGHWANEKFCPAMKRDIREKEKEVRIPIAPGLPDNQSNNKGRFAGLSVDDDSDDDEQLIGRKRERDVPLPKAGVSWASMASQEPIPKPDKSVTIYVSQKVNKPVELTAKEKEAFKILAERKRENIKTWDWAADSDSEDEESECTSAW